MNLKTIQVCRTRDGWQPVEVPSATRDLSYVVLVNPWGTPNENICHCEGYTFQGRCRHQTEAVNKVCGWSERDPVRQDQYQRSGRTCPLCAGPTKFEVEVTDE